MKTPLVFGALAFLCAALPSHAGLDLGWDDCVTAGGVSDKTLPCAGFAAADLYGNFQLDNPVDLFISLDISLDIQTEADPSGDFWNFGGGECNDGNLSMAVGKLGHCDNSSPAMCFATGAQCQNVFAWASFFNGTSRHRLVGSIFRDATAPIALAAASNYFAFKFSFFTFSAVEGGGGPCLGCLERAAITWNSALASGLAAGVGSDAQEEPIEGPGLADNCASFNGGGSVCGADATEPRTWGQIKSLYR